MQPVVYDAFKDKVVRKSNTLVLNSRFDLTTAEQKIVYALCSMINPGDEDFLLYPISMVDMCRLCGLDSAGGQNYKIIKESIKKLADKSIWVTLEDGTETILRFIDKFFITPDKGKILVKISEDMHPYLLALKGNYTSFELIYTLRFKSKYSIRLYEIIKASHFDKTKPYSFQLQLDKLRYLLNVTGDYYQQYQRFSNKVLMPSIMEINEKTDINITIEPIRVHRKTESIEFFVNPKAINQKLVAAYKTDNIFNDSR